MVRLPGSVQLPSGRFLLSLRLRLSAPAFAVVLQLVPSNPLYVASCPETELDTALLNPSRLPYLAGHEPPNEGELAYADFGRNLRRRVVLHRDTSSIIFTLTCLPIRERIRLKRKSPGANQGLKAGLALRNDRKNASRHLVSDSKISEIAERGLELPEAAKLAGLARTNYRNRARKLGYGVTPGRSGRPRLFEGCSIPLCTEPHSSNGLCRRHFNKWYYRQNSSKAKDRANEQREASRRHVSREELDRLRHPENRHESLCYGPGGKVVHLACGWVGDDLTHHIRHCRVKPEGWNTYSECWGFDLSVPPVSPRQREAYSEKQQRIWASVKRRSSMARNRWGKGTDPRFQTRKISNSKILEIVAANPGLSLTEGAKLASMSRVGFYKRVKKLGDSRNLVPAPRPQREFVRLASDPQLRNWVASRQQNFVAEPFLEFCMDNLDHGLLTPSQFALFILHLEKELREHPEWIAEIARKIAGRKPAETTLRLGNRVFERVRAGLKNPAKRQAGPAKTEPRKTAWFELGRKIEELVSKGADVTEARRRVKGHYDFDTVVRYHMKYRKHLRAL